MRFVRRIPQEENWIMWSVDAQIELYTQMNTTARWTSQKAGGVPTQKF